MAKKSKTQRAKASASRAAKREQSAVESTEVEAKDVAEANAEAEQPKRTFFKKAQKDAAPAEKKQIKKEEKKPEKKAKKPNFLTEVRAEMKRVTWPTKADVLRWSGVVVVALLFFGIYVSVLDNLIVTPVLIAISGLGA